MLRGGAFKPRSSPYAFQGLGQEGLDILVAAREETGLPIVTEPADARHVEAVVEAADVIQIGARNMQNFTLLSEVGRAQKPVLEAGPGIVDRGAPDGRRVHRQRGELAGDALRAWIRTFERATRFTLDIGAVPVLKGGDALPVVVDPRMPRAGGIWWRRSRGQPSPRGGRDHRRGSPELTRRASGRRAADRGRRLRRLRGGDSASPRSWAV